jgi:uncharacterized protein (TIGR00369 family)
VSPETLRAGWRAIRENRRRRLHLFAHHLGLRWQVVRPGTVRVSLAAGPDWCGSDGRPGPGPVATLADVGMGLALRSLAPAGSRFPTVALDLSHAEAPRGARLVAVGRAWSLSPSVGLARVEVRAPGAGPVAVGSGAFLRRQLPEGTAPPALARQPVAPPARPAWADLEGEERRFLVALEAARERQRGAADPYAAYLGLACAAGAGGETEVAMPLAATTANLVGQAQGGVVYALAAAAAARAGGGTLLQMGLRFLRPGVGPTLRARARVLHAGRDVATVAGGVLTDDGARAAEFLASVRWDAGAAPPAGGGGP